ncbi:hypothetical protein [Streptomyces sp. NPDC002215]|uniref:hypothetical protein n=1 Tax=Streptomyces sp. NPDC002215 TaxID=3154412 RepID=UPI003323C667
MSASSANSRGAPSAGAEASASSHSRSAAAMNARAAAGPGCPWRIAIQARTRSVRTSAGTSPSSRHSSPARAYAGSACGSRPAR